MTMRVQGCGSSRNGRRCRRGKIFADYGERAAVGEHFEVTYVALNKAFRGGVRPLV